MKTSLSIRTALVVLAVVLIVPLGTIAGFIFWDLAADHKAQVGKAMLAEASSLARGIDLQIATARAALETLSHTEAFQKRDYAALHAAALRMVAAGEGAFNVVLFAPDGSQLLNTLRPFGEPLPNAFQAGGPPEQAGGLPHSSAGWIREAFQRGEPFLTDLFFGIVAQQPIVALLVPVRVGGEASVWSYAFRLHGLQRRLAANKRDPDWQAVLVDRAGFIVARYPRHEEFVGKPAGGPLRTAAAASPSAFEPGKTLEGTSIYRAHVRTADGWSMVVARPRTSVSAEVQGPAIWWSTAVAAFLLGGLLYVAWLARQLATPLRRLSESAYEVQEGRVPPLETALREVANLRDALTDAARARQVAIRLALLEGLVRHAPVSIALFDRDLRLIQLNERAAAFAGIPVEAHAGKTLPELLGRFGKEMDGYLRRVRDTGEPIFVPELAAETPASPGRQRWWIAEFFPLKDHAGVVTHVGAVGLEITDRKNAELALREADRRKDVYLATLAHELRNPLTPLRNAVALLHLKGPRVPELIEARDMIDRQAAQMARLLDDLLEVSRIAQGKLELRLAPVDVVEVIDEALETAKPALEHHDVRRHAPATRVWVRGDRLRLTQIFANLLNNAGKYTDRGGRIEIRIAAGDNEAIVEVADNGMGIDPGMIERLFEPFSQSDKALHRAHGGLGIGLALVRGLVELHGGSVTARSAGPGKGSQFVVRLPLGEPPVEAAPARKVFDKAMPLDSKILVADDNRDGANSLAALLRLSGATVQVAYDGLSALEQAQRNPPQIAILDIGMPGLDGYRLAGELSRLIPKPYLIAVTGWGQETDRAAARNAGFDRHLTKPVDPVELLPLLREIQGPRS